MDRDHFERWCQGTPPDRQPLLERWWNAWRLGRRGDPGARSELARQVALDASAAGERGELCSRSLDPWLRLRHLDASAEALALQDELLRAAADAHAIGVARRVARLEAGDAVRRVPIVSPREGVVAVVLAGPMDAALLDAALDRAFRHAVATGARQLLIDVARSEVEADLLVRTLSGLPDVGLPAALAVGIVGLPGALEANLHGRELRGVTRYRGWSDALTQAGPA